MNSIEMYSSSHCPFCTRAKKLLASKGHSVIREVKIDVDDEARTQMVERSGRRSVPQIFINGHHVGGFDDLAALNHSGGLDHLLSA